MDKGEAISKGLIEYWDKKGRKKEDTPAPRKNIGVNASIQAIKDKYGDEAEEAVDVFLEYNRNRYSISSLVAERNALKIKKGMSKSERQAIKAKRAEFNAKLKEVRAKQKELRKEAKRIKNLNRAKKKLAKQEKTFAKNREAMKRTEKRIRDLQKRLSQGKGDPAKIRELLRKAENRLQNQANRNDGLVESMSETKNVIANKGVVESTQSSPFGLSEYCKGHKYTLSFKPYRELNEREKLVNWTKLNDSFTSIEEELRTELETIITEEVERISEKVERELSAGEIAFILALLFMIFGKLKAKIKEVMTRAYNEGVRSAVSETKADTPKTPTAIKQQINIESEIIATTIEENLNNEAKSIIQNAFLAGAGAVAIATAMRDSLKKRSIQYSSNVAGLAGKYVNVGRSTVFNTPQLKTKIVGYQRSEVLDSRTCFPKNTKIATSKGLKNIQDLKVGELVLTRQGYKKIVNTMKRDYVGDLVEIKTKQSKFVCTGNHPIFANSKWIQARDLEVGDVLLNMRFNKLWQVCTAVNSRFGKSTYIKSLLDKIFIFLGVSSFVSVPIVSINFYTEQNFREKDFCSLEVYNIEVESKHEYFANFSLVHNCNICRALDGRIVKADDPFASLTQVHNNCRGINLPLYDIKEIGQAGIPKSIQDRFNLVGGYPIPNDFKQIKNDKKDSR